MQDVNRRAAEGDWKTALLDHPDATVRAASEMILNLDRANWHWLIDLPPASRVLDLGAGTGTNSHALARYYREVVAVEPVLERVEFMRHRFTQERLDNVKIIRTSLWDLPFPGATFDLVVMNGVLEWVATGVPGDPGALQRAALDNVFRLLRPGGYFYLGIENRLSLGSFVGYPDPHCGVPWVTILPRAVADWYARRHGQPGGYRQYLYSAGGYRRLLESAGFSEIEIYLALPSYNHPRFLLPLEDHIFEHYFYSFTKVPTTWTRRLGMKAALKLGLLKYCDYSFAILGRK